MLQTENNGVDILGDFQSFYTALLAVMATHEELCKLWNNHPQKIPFISTVLIHSAHEWVRVIRLLNGQNKNVVEAIVSDLTYGAVTNERHNLQRRCYLAARTAPSQ
jgi:hypothetical protein